MQPIKFKHSLNSGDLIANLAGIKHLCTEKGRKAVIFQRLDMKADYYEGAKHPVQDGTGAMVTMNKKQWEMLKPLLEAQSYIERAEEWIGQKTDLTFDQLLEGNYANRPYGLLQRWGFYVIPSLACDLSKPWLELSWKNPDDTILVNLTERYRNSTIDYSFLKKYESRLVFAGAENEYKLFCETYSLNAKRLLVDNFLQLAQAINACKVFLGNQSMCYHIAESLGHARILELCNFAPNTFPLTPNGYDFFHQEALEYYVEKLLK